MPIKKTYLSTAIIIFGLWIAASAFGQQKQNQDAPPAFPMPKIQASNLNRSDIEKIVADYIKTRQVILKGEQGEVGPKGDKGEKGDPGLTNNSTSDNSINGSFQQTYIPSAIISPDTGSLFAVKNLSSDNIISGSADFGNINSDGDFTLQGNADFQGTTILATSTIINLNVGALTSDSGAFLSDGGVWTNASSKELKENFANVDADEILNKIAALPIYQWNYKKEAASIMHIGPTAEDFYENFGLAGEKGKISISTIDPAGVALAGIQALNKRIEVLEKKLENKNAQATMPEQNNNLAKIIDSPLEDNATSTSEQIPEAE